MQRPVTPSPAESSAPAGAAAATVARVPAGGGALALICLGLPAFFVLGAAGFAWIIPGLLMTVVLARSDGVRYPVGSGILLLFLGWVGLSVLRVSDFATLFLFVYRYLLWVSMAAAFVWVVHVPVRQLSSERIVGWLSAMWLIFIGFGYAALAFPRLRLTTPVQVFLPESLLANTFLRELTEFRFAEFQEFLSFQFARPAAPLTYANGWGSAVGILAPVFVQHWMIDSTPRRRRFAFVALLVAFVPIVLSLNRGLWLSLAVGFGYVALIEARRGHPRLLGIVGAVGVLAVVAVLVTPLGDSVRSRFESTTDSNADRENVIVEAFDATVDSPLLGYAQPQQREDGLPVGTHGLVWYTMFSHGFPALLLLLWWMWLVVRRTRDPVTSVAEWCHVALVVGCLQTFFYGLQPHTMLLGLLAGLCLRERLAVRSGILERQRR